MKVSVYKNEDGTMSALVQASPGKGRPPVVIPTITPENVREKILPVVVAMRAPKESKQLRLL